MPTPGPILSVAEQRAISAVASFDPILQDAGQEVVSYLPKPEGDKKKFAIFALIGAIAALCEIIQFCRDLKSGAEFKEAARTAGPVQRFKARRHVAQGLKYLVLLYPDGPADGEVGFHAAWTFDRQVRELTLGLIRFGREADVGRLEQVRVKALAQASVGGKADKPMKGRPDGAGEEREREDIEAVGRGDAGDIGEPT